MGSFSKALTLIAHYLQKKEDSSLSFDAKEASFLFELGKNHSISAFLNQAIEFVKPSFPKDIKERFSSCYLQAVRKAVVFEKEYGSLKEYLTEAGIDYLPLKGLILKDYYPDPYEREFADHDILFFQEEDAEKIRDYFKGRGYEVEHFRKGNHDVYLKKPFLNFEMHRSLFSVREDTQLFAEYFQDMKPRCLQKEGHEYSLKDEDFYLYFLAHAYKHYDAGGNGLRMLLDCYLFLKGRDLDRSYLEEELKKLNLVEFEKMLSSLTIDAFEKETLSEEEKKTLLYIGKSGTYGTVDNAVKKGVKKKGKFSYLMSRIFPPISFYQEAYPWAYRHKILIPFAWIGRFFRILFKNPKKAANELKAIKNAEEEKE